MQSLNSRDTCRNPFVKYILFTLFLRCCSAQQCTTLQLISVFEPALPRINDCQVSISNGLSIGSLENCTNPCFQIIEQLSKSLATQHCTLEISELNSVFQAIQLLGIPVPAELNSIVTILEQANVSSVSTDQFATLANVFDDICGRVAGVSGTCVSAYRALSNSTASTALARTTACSELNSGLLGPCLCLLNNISSIKQSIFGRVTCPSGGGSPLPTLLPAGGGSGVLSNLTQILSFLCEPLNATATVRSLASSCPDASYPQPNCTAAALPTQAPSTAAAHTNPPSAHHMSTGKKGSDGKLIDAAIVLGVFIALGLAWFVFKLIRTSKRTGSTTVGSTRNAAFSGRSQQYEQHSVHVEGHVDLDDDDDVALMLMD
eukprot:m.160539 g.160539  ORF g.160539 m.160539 type:complete len:375 (-) comp18029_c0_seq4:831-1955(-)